MVPIHILVGENDKTCSLKQTRKIAKEIGPAVRSFDIIPNAEHNIVAMTAEKNILELVLYRLQ